MASPSSGASSVGSEAGTAGATGRAPKIRAQPESVSAPKTNQVRMTAGLKDSTGRTDKLSAPKFRQRSYARALDFLTRAAPIAPTLAEVVAPAQPRLNGYD